MTQIPLDLILPARWGRDDFLLSSSNRAALDAVERWPVWPDPVMMLVGPPGSGKTHLSHIWAALAGARLIDAESLAGDPPSVAASPAVIDGADAEPLAEAPFFHLLNLVRQANSSLLITARLPPDRWGLRTPDLLSRLRLAPLVSIDPPDEALIRLVLIKLFDERQLRVEASLIDYLTLRLDRSLDAARRAVEALDVAGLSRGTRITRTMAIEALKMVHIGAD